MTPRDSDRRLRRTLETVANTLQTTVLVAEHVQRTSVATAKDVQILARGLRRATKALQKLGPEPRSAR